jgi:hypothetical protein
MDDNRRDGDMGKLEELLATTRYIANKADIAKLKANSYF